MMMGMVATMCQLRNAWSEARDKQAEAMGVVQNAKLLAAQAALAEAEAAQERLEVGHPSPPLSSLLTPHPVRLRLRLLVAHRISVPAQGSGTPAGPKQMAETRC